MQYTDVTSISPISDIDETLVFNDTSNKPWMRSAYPLHILARSGSPLDIETLLIAGEDVNKEDLLSTRPLHVAALSGNNEAIKLFLQYGADVNDDSYDNVTALHLAIKHENFDSAMILLEHGADPMAGKKEDVTPFELTIFTLFQYIEAFEETESPKLLPILDELIQIIELMGPECSFYLRENPEESVESSEFAESVPYNVILKVLASELDPSAQKDALLTLAASDSAHENYYVNAKTLLHIFPTGNNYDLNVEGQKEPLSAEGFTKIYTTPFVMHSLEAYVNKIEQAAEQDPLAHHIFSKLEKSYSLATELALNQTDYATCEKALEAYYDGQTIILPTGWDGHFVNTILSHPQSVFASANSGQRYDAHEAGVTFYKIYDPYDIDADFIYDILNNEDELFLEYEAIYQYGLLENIDFMPGNNQEHGNCALQSHREGIRGLLYIELLNEGLTPELAREQGEMYFQEWNTFLNYYTLQQYFSENVGLPTEAYTDIFLDINLEQEKPLTKSEKDISQTLVNALMTPEYLPEFNSWLKEAVGYYGKQEIQKAFEPYGLDVGTLIAHPLHYHQHYIMPEHVTDPLTGL